MSVHVDAGEEGVPPESGRRWRTRVPGTVGLPGTRRAVRASLAQPAGRHDRFDRRTASPVPSALGAYPFFPVRRGVFPRGRCPASSYFSRCPATRRPTSRATGRERRIPPAVDGANRAEGDLGGHRGLRRVRARDHRRNRPREHHGVCGCLRCAGFHRLGQCANPHRNDRHRRLRRAAAARLGGPPAGAGVPRNRWNEFRRLPRGNDGYRGSTGGI